MASHDKTETLCATCARAYARPDPAGCAFHRRDYISREIEGHPYSKAKIVNRGHDDKAIIVQECDDHVYDPRFRKPPNQKLTEEQEERIYRLRTDKKLQYREIGRKVGCSPTTARDAYYRYERNLRLGVVV